MMVYRNQFDSLLNHSEVAVNLIAIWDVLVLAPVALWDVSKHKIHLDAITVHWNTKSSFFPCQKCLIFFMPCYFYVIFLYFCNSLSVLHSSGEYNFCKPKVRLDHFVMTAESTKTHLSLNYRARAISNSKAAFM